jgi:hypothetical protein
VIFGIWKDSKDSFFGDDARLYIVIPRATPSPSACAPQGGDFGAHLIDCLRKMIDGTAAFTERAVRSLLGSGGRLRNTAGADADRGSLQGVCKCGDGGRFASTHAADQQLSLPVEELQNFPLKPTVVEGHAGQVRAV